jgi:hypothetical protein
MLMLLKYTNDWHQPLIPTKSELVVYHKSVQCRRLNVYYDGIKILQKNNFKYLGFHLDSKLSFRCMIDAQFIKLRKAYVILNYIHRQFPSFMQLKIKSSIHISGHTCLWCQKFTVFSPRLLVIV